jgi:predicted RNase H-like HicB family nuclease
MSLHVEIDREDDGRWIGEIPDLPGVFAYGQSRREALDRVRALALRVIANRLEKGEWASCLDSVFSAASSPPSIATEPTSE